MNCLSKLGIDDHVFFTLLYRGWNIIAGAMVVFIVPYFFSDSEQGYYFTFSSLIASQVFFELGLNYVITQIIAHEAINVTVGSQGELSGKVRSVERVYSLLCLVRKWYFFIAAFFLLIVSLFGMYFFSMKGSLPFDAWGFAWLAHVFFTSINLYISPYYSILDGLGKVAASAKLRFVQSIASYAIFAILAISGAGLYSIVAISFFNSLIGVGGLFLKFREIFWIKRMAVTHSISWQREIFPFQWKIAISWLSGYFIFQLFNPLVFAHQGAIVAGRMGLSMSIFSTLLGLAMGWVTAKSPVIAGYISAGDKQRAKELFFGVMLRSSILNFILGVAFIIFVLLLIFFDFKIAARLLSVPDLILILGTTMINQLIFSMASYMRAHKEEPMLLNSICVAILTVSGLYFSSFYSVTIVLSLYFITLVFIALPWTYALFKKYV